MGTDYNNTDKSVHLVLNDGSTKGIRNRQIEIFRNCVVGWKQTIRETILETIISIRSCSIN